VAHHIRNGAQGRTIGPLKPSGRIFVDGETVNARSEGIWIETDTNVVVIGSDSRNLIVRPTTENGPPDVTTGQMLTVEDLPETTPLHAPRAVVERINAVACGSVIGCLLIPLVWLNGAALHMTAFFLPVNGAAAGFLFQWFVKGAFDAAGPRDDHRPQANAIAACVTAGAAIGAVVGLNAGFGFLGISCGLVLGALLAGFMSWLGLLLLAI
jgi:hypothetical protein